MDIFRHFNIYQSTMLGIYDTLIQLTINNKWSNAI